MSGSRTPLSRKPIRTPGATMAPDAGRAATAMPGVDYLDGFEVAPQAEAQIVSAHQGRGAPSPINP